MKTTLIIHSCDKYNYILPDFFRHFNNFKSALENIGISIWLTTEELDSSNLCSSNVITGKESWSFRLKTAIEAIPKTDDVILVQEDFFFTHMDIPSIEKSLWFHKLYDAHITKLGSFYEFNLEDIGFNINQHNVYVQNAGHYTMSHQPVAVFDTNFLLQTLDKHRDPWEHECDVTKEINDGKYGKLSIYTVGNIFNPNKSEIMTSHHAMRKGVYYPI